MRLVLSELAVIACFTAVHALPAISDRTSLLLSSVKRSVPAPIVIWHGLGDRYDAPGLLALKTDLEAEEALKGVYVHLIGVSEDGSADQRSTFFGNANQQIASVCETLSSIPEIVDKELNPSGKIDAIGFSQGGQLLRGLIERCSVLRFGRLITLGSQHMGISALPACPPDSSPFSTCRLFRLSLVKNGLYSLWAQENLLPAQYVRDEARIDEYMKVNHFLKDINNERRGDEQVGPPAELRSIRDGRDEGEPRNATYKRNFSRLDKLVLYRFSLDATVVPPQSAHFTLPSPDAEPCPVPLSPKCYVDPVAFSDLPLYKEDYIGLKTLNDRGNVWKGICKGAHMEIDDKCWDGVKAWLIGKGPEKETEKVDDEARFVWQL